jgi:plasmid stabilization system protein ParE
MIFSFHPEAEEELNQAVEYYEGIESGLGFDFAGELYSTMQRIASFPKAWPVIEGEIRRSMVRRFPYGVLYSEEQEELFIVAVMNLHRDPDYWKHRK